MAVPLQDSTVFSILAGLSFVPPLVFLLWVRAHENNDREPVRAVLVAFLYGGSAGVAIAILLHVLFQFGYDRAGGPLPLASALLAAVIIAPIVEEFAKALGLGLVRKHMDEVEDGIIYGAGIGLGFAATENFVYGLAGLEGGFGAAVTTISVRVFSSMLLHACASALIGYGYGLAVMRGGVPFEALPYYLGAVLLHAGYNFLVSTQAWWGFVAALVLVATLFGTLRRRIRDFDALPHDPQALR